ncbi:MAG: shikimate kinase [Acidimicrobiia bacterium]
MTLWLIGMMGSGKSSAGRMAADHLDVPFFDTDVEIETSADMAIGDIFSTRGESAFREMESSTIDRLAGRVAVVATGGGAVLDRDNVEKMRNTGPVLLLQASHSTLNDRLGDPAGRPLLDPGSPERDLIAIDEERRHLYVTAATEVIDTDHLDVSEVARRIEQLWNS